jgi:hypothetical protein
VRLQVAPPPPGGPAHAEGCAAGAAAGQPAVLRLDGRTEAAAAAPRIASANSASQPRRRRHRRRHLRGAAAQALAWDQAQAAAQAADRRRQDPRRCVPQPPRPRRPACRRRTGRWCSSTAAGRPLLGGSHCGTGVGSSGRCRRRGGEGPAPWPAAGCAARPASAPAAADSISAAVPATSGVAKLVPTVMSKLSVQIEPPASGRGVPVLRAGQDRIQAGLAGRDVDAVAARCAIAISGPRSEKPTLVPAWRSPATPITPGQLAGVPTGLAHAVAGRGDDDGADAR